MSLPFFLSALKSHRSTALIWGAFAFAFAVLVMYLYPTFENMALDYLELMPEQLLRAVGLEGIIAGGGFTLELYVTSEFLGWWPVVVTIYAIFTMGGTVAHEVDKGTMDLLLSQPLRRYQVVSSKFVVFVLGLAFIQLISFAGLIVGLLLIDTTAPLWGIFLALVQGAFLILAVGSYSIFFSCLFLDPRKTLMASGGLTAALYILNFMSPSLGSYEWINRLSLFHYYLPGKIVQDAALDWTGVAVLLVVAALCFIAALAVFQRKDIVT